MTTFLDEVALLFNTKSSGRSLKIAKTIIKNKSINFHLTGACEVAFIIDDGKNGKVIFKLREPIPKMLDNLSRENFLFDMASCVSSEQIQKIFEKHLTDFKLKGLVCYCSCSKKRNCTHILATKMSLHQELQRDPSAFIRSVILGEKSDDEYDEDEDDIDEEYLRDSGGGFALILFTQWASLAEQRLQIDYFGMKSPTLTGKDFNLLINHLRFNESRVNALITHVLRYDDDQESVLGWLQGMYDPHAIDRFTEFSWKKFSMDFKEMQKFIERLEGRGK